jgi:hypothetical protein
VIIDVTPRRRHPVRNAVVALTLGVALVVLLAWAAVATWPSG